MRITFYNARSARGLSLRQLAQLTGIGKSTLHRIENEETSPTLNQLEAVAKALNMRICDLFESDYK